MNGYITYTEGVTGEWVCWMTETQPPRHATVVSMFLYPGEVHFGMGATKEAALAKLEADLRPVTDDMIQKAEHMTRARESGD